MRGPLVYCFEEEDNGKNLNTLLLPRTSLIKCLTKNELSIGQCVELEADAIRLNGENRELYTEYLPEITKTKIRAVPYYLWGNRQHGEMRVWIRELFEFNK